MGTKNPDPERANFRKGIFFLGKRTPITVRGGIIRILSYGEWGVFSLFGKSTHMRTYVWRIDGWTKEFGGMSNRMER